MIEDEEPNMFNNELRLHASDPGMLWKPSGMVYKTRNGLINQEWFLINQEWFENQEWFNKPGKAALT